MKRSFEGDFSMLSLLLIALAAPAAAAAAMPAAPTPSPLACRIPGVIFARPGKAATRAQKLGELPPANHYLAVDRRIGDCPEPAIVSTGIGTGRK
jgi:hypothetical protein